MVKTLVSSKKAIIAPIRDRLLAEGYSEDIEYDAINVEPVMIYRKATEKVVFIRHKWELVALVPVSSDETRMKVRTSYPDFNLSEFEALDEQGNSWFRFHLPEEDDLVFKILESL
jgi:hypothetical protein